MNPLGRPGLTTIIAAPARARWWSTAVTAGMGITENTGGAGRLRYW